MNSPDTASRLNIALEGRYAIEREISEGGMATVYLADDLKHERNVALKCGRGSVEAADGRHDGYCRRLRARLRLVTHPSRATPTAHEPREGPLPQVFRIVRGGPDVSGCGGARPAPSEISLTPFESSCVRVGPQGP